MHADDIQTLKKTHNKILHHYHTRNKPIHIVPNKSHDNCFVNMNVAVWNQVHGGFKENCFERQFLPSNQFPEQKSTVIKQ